MSRYESYHESGMPALDTAHTAEFQHDYHMQYSNWIGYESSGQSRPLSQFDYNYWSCQPPSHPYPAGWEQFATTQLESRVGQLRAQPRPPPDPPNRQMPYAPHYQPYRSQQHPSYQAEPYPPPPPHSPYLAYGVSTYQGSDPNRLQSTTHLNGQPQPRKFINSAQQHGLPNNPDLMVRSFSPAQLAAVNDYNEKLRVYRLDQAALLARVTAWFEENIDDENITEEKIDNTPTMVVSADVPKDIHDIPNGITDVAINAAIGVDMSDEVEQSEGSLEEAREILRDNKVVPRSALQVLPQNRMIGGQSLLDKDGVGQVPLKVLDIAMANINLPRRYAKEFFKLTRSRMFSKSVIAFDPGGETSTLLFSPTLFVAVASWFPP